MAPAPSAPLLQDRCAAKLMEALVAQVDEQLGNSAP